MLRFSTGLRIPPTSNQAERGLRPAKTQQKIPGRLRSEQVTRDRYAIRGCICTVARHGAHVLTAIHDALAGNPWMPPSLTRPDRPGASGERACRVIGGKVQPLTAKALPKSVVGGWPPGPLIVTRQLEPGIVKDHDQTITLPEVRIPAVTRPGLHPVNLCIRDIYPVQVPAARRAVLVERLAFAGDERPADPEIIKEGRIAQPFSDHYAAPLGELIHARTLGPAAPAYIPGKGPVSRVSLSTQSHRAGFALGGPGFQVLAVAMAEHFRELAEQVTGGGEFWAAGGDPGEVGPVGVGEPAGRGEDPAGPLPGCWRGWGRGDGGVVAEPGGEPAQGAQAAPVAAFAQFLVQPAGAAHALVPALAQVGLVRAEQARPGQAGPPISWSAVAAVA